MFCIESGSKRPVTDVGHRLRCDIACKTFTSVPPTLSQVWLTVQRQLELGAPGRRPLACADNLTLRQASSKLCSVGRRRDACRKRIPLPLSLKNINNLSISFSLWCGCNFEIRSDAAVKCEAGANPALPRNCDREGAPSRQPGRQPSEALAPYARWRGRAQMRTIALQRNVDRPARLSLIVEENARRATGRF